MAKKALKTTLVDSRADVAEAIADGAEVVIATDTDTIVHVAADPIPSEPVDTVPDITVANPGGAIVVTVRGFDPITIEAHDLEPHIQRMAMMHGLKQKLSDAGAKSRGTPLGDKYDSILAVAEALQRGEWTTKRAAGEGSSTLLVQALANVYGKPVADMRTFVEGLPKAERDIVRNDPAVASAIATLKTARKPAGPSAADILSRIMQP